MPPRIDLQNPYTYAEEFVRILAAQGENGTKLSRSDASRIYSGIAAAIGMDVNAIARKLAYHYQINQNAITEKDV